MELIITEKPSAAKRIAQSLADGKLTQKKDPVAYFELEHGGRQIMVVPAVGHLFSVAEKKKSFTYPSYDIDWKPTYEQDKKNAYAKKYAMLIKKLAKQADTFTVACDYDVEGEVIGHNIIRFLCGQKDASRMKFSTLTKPDLVESYSEKSPHINWGQAKAGETRHFLDWLYGINISRALTLAIRKSKTYMTMSSGRVQGPALRLLAEREIEIQQFIPETYWQLLLSGNLNNKDITALHIKDKFWREEDATRALKKATGDGTVSKVEKSQVKQFAPNPFDLTTLQTESFRNFGLNPKHTLDIAQDLYVKGYISYPRTSSQQLSPKIGFRRIIEQLSKQAGYKELASGLLNKQNLFPNNGKKTDPAHPAIYPTGIAPKLLEAGHKKVYDLIAKRFLATFGEPAIRESVQIEIDVNSEIFVAKGITTQEQGWFKLYQPYVKLKEEELPPTKAGDRVLVNDIEKQEKQTKPPKRYTQASIIKELEKRQLGTKSTRAQIIQNLIDRKYIRNNPLEVSRIGLITVQTLEKYSPEIIDEELTRSFEEAMDKIREDGQKPQEVLDRAKKELDIVLAKFKKNEQEIGNILSQAYRYTEEMTNLIGDCPVCGQGKLRIKFSKHKTKFIACDAYPDCRTTFSLPSKGLVKPLEEKCPKCSYPMISVINRKKFQKICINPNCESKAIDDSAIGESCPKCKEGKLVLKQSVYGQFYACDRFPKCRFTKNSVKPS